MELNELLRNINELDMKEYNKLLNLSKKIIKRHCSKKGIDNVLDEFEIQSLINKTIIGFNRNFKEERGIERGAYFYKSLIYEHKNESYKKIKKLNNETDGIVKEDGNEYSILDSFGKEEKMFGIEKEIERTKSLSKDQKTMLLLIARGETMEYVSKIFNTTRQVIYYRLRSLQKNKDIKSLLFA